jgi:hypothetical protein
MQFDVFANPARSTRLAFPLVVDLQADLVAGRLHVVSFLARAVRFSDTDGKLLPRVRVGDEEYLVTVGRMATVPIAALGASTGSVAAWRDDILRAIDWLFFGLP